MKHDPPNPSCIAGWTTERVPLTQTAGHREKMACGLIDTWVYRLPAGVDPAVLVEDSAASGKYRIKTIAVRR